MSRDEREAEATELRLALVCYGGVSLAVYMHGVTKELHKLVVASRRFDQAGADADNPFGAADTEHAYFEALRTLARQGHPLSVSIDIVAGTSAGGINGVVLSKVLARNGEQEGLRRMWIEEGDLRGLLRSLPVGGVRLRAALAVARLLGSLRTPTSPLKGERMSRLLLRAMRDIDRTAHAGPSLLPPRGTLDLFVTLTDLHGFEVLVPTGSGGISQRDRAHAQVLHFRAEAGSTEQFGPEATPALAFAARATASFPGAFAPLSLASFQTEANVPLDPDLVAEHFTYRYDENGVLATDAWFVDGGVLDNAPFDLVVEAIRTKRAETEVVRRVVYIQPDPGRPLAAAAGATDSQPVEEPSWLDGVWRATVGVKGSHAVLRDLLAFRDLNLRIGQVGAITASQMSLVLRHIDEVSGAGSGAGWSVSDEQAVQKVSDELHARTRKALGAGFATYCRLKVEAAGRRLADEVVEHFVFPPDSSRSSFVRAAVGAWARGRDEWADPDPDRLLAMLGPVDVPYRERRLLFILAGINGLYAASDTNPRPPRAHLDALKKRAWDLLDALRTAPHGAVAGVPSDALAFLSAKTLDDSRFENPERFAREHATEFETLFGAYRDALRTELGDGSSSLWLAFAEGTDGWDDGLRRELLSRYLGFPLWDGLIFPTVALAQLPQFTPIGVSQYSPGTARALPTPAGGKLKGVTLHHFGGFLKAEWRENDYLWGRLDGAELILRSLFETAQPDGAPPSSAAEAVQTAGGAHLQDALRAVLRSEAGLRRSSDTLKGLADAVEQLPMPAN